MPTHAAPCQGKSLPHMQVQSPCSKRTGKKKQARGKKIWKRAKTPDEPGLVLYSFFFFGAYRQPPRLSRHPFVDGPSRLPMMASNRRAQPPLPNIRGAHIKTDINISLGLHNAMLGAKYSVPTLLYTDPLFCTCEMDPDFVSGIAAKKVIVPYRTTYR